MSSRSVATLIAARVGGHGSRAYTDFEPRRQNFSGAPPAWGALRLSSPWSATLSTAKRSSTGWRRSKTPGSSASCRARPRSDSA